MSEISCLLITAVEADLRSGRTVETVLLEDYIHLNRPRVCGLPGC